MTASRGLPRRTIRLRLTLFYSSLFLISGAVLLAVTYALVRFTVPVASAYSHSAASPGLHSGSRGGAGSAPKLARLPSLASLQAQDSRQSADDLHQLLVVSGFVLIGMALGSVLLGWLVAGRALRPLRTITAAARDVSSASLHRRLALDGPDDELKELADTFDGLLGRLERSFRSQRQFVANASHELRTPLTLERALLEAVLTEPDPTAESFRATCERLLATNARQDRLIEALLTLATSERGLDRWEPFDLAVLTSQVLAARQAEAERLGLHLEKSLAPAPAWGDPDLAERLIANLADNALRYNSPGGRVELVTGAEAGQATLRASNTGPAVPTQELEELFQPFRRLGSGRTGQRGGSGHGLGLSIVTAIVNAHGAVLDARARQAGGLDVEVRFPAARGSAD
jgi:signal transduction histidine kinase